jgi:mono/diheme cytochrome c family protein
LSSTNKSLITDLKADVAEGLRALDEGESPESVTEVSSARVSDVDRGRQVFNRSRAGCHGSDGKNIAYSGGDLTNMKKRMSLEQIVAWIKNPAPPMSKVFPEPLQASEEADLRDLAEFIHEWPP